MKVKQCSVCERPVLKLWRSNPKMCQPCAMREKVSQKGYKPPATPKEGDVFKKKGKFRGTDGKFVNPPAFRIVSITKTAPTIKHKVTIKKVSDKQAKLNKAYSALRKVFLEQHPVCMAQWEGCAGVATECHHSKGRIGAYMLDSSTYKALCNNCHTLVELSPERAKKAGISKSRLSKQ